MSMPFDLPRRFRASVRQTLPGACAMLLLMLACGAARAQDMPLTQILIDGEGWKLVSQDFKTPWALAGDANGNVFVGDPEAGQILRIDRDSKVTSFAKLSDVRALAFDANGHLVAAQPTDVSIRALDADARIVWQAKLANGVWHLAAARNGVVYASVPAEQAVYAVTADNKARKVAEGIGRPAGLALWPDQGTLVVADAVSSHMLALRIDKNGSLTCRENYSTLRVPPEAKASAATGATVDAIGRVYVASPEGVQIYDTQGRLAGVLLKPGDGVITALTFGGMAGDTLYAACGTKVFARKTKTRGLFPTAKP